MTVLSLAIAAIAATWLPFSLLYINALNKAPMAVTAITAPANPQGHGARSAPVVTRSSLASGGAAPQSTSSVAATPVVSHAS